MHRVCFVFRYRLFVLHLAASHDFTADIPVAPDHFGYTCTFKSPPDKENTTFDRDGDGNHHHI